jgi:hypothetical protein
VKKFCFEIRLTKKEREVFLSKEFPGMLPFRGWGQAKKSSSDKWEELKIYRGIKKLDPTYLSA